MMRIVRETVNELLEAFVFPRTDGFLNNFIVVMSYEAFCLFVRRYLMPVQINTPANTIVSIRSEKT